MWVSRKYYLDAYLQVLNLEQTMTYDSIVIERYLLCSITYMRDDLWKLMKLKQEDDLYA